MQSDGDAEELGGEHGWGSRLSSKMKMDEKRRREEEERQQELKETKKTLPSPKHQGQAALDPRKVGKGAIAQQGFA